VSFAYGLPVKILSAEFIRSCLSVEQLPAGAIPEIAFAGRSNVGKSSLINALVQRKGLAKVSRTPGKTRALNLFAVRTDDLTMPRCHIVDLPGYGYAKVSKKVRAQWGPMVEGYLASREQLRAVVLLVESRVPREQDGETITWLTSIGRPPIVVATKADKLKTSERVGALRFLHDVLAIHDREALIPFSSVTGEGRDRLWAALKLRVQT
jgi:GTP-binding protein